MSPQSRISQITRHMSTKAAQHLCIGDVCIPIGRSASPRIPLQPIGNIEDQEILAHLQWLLKKDLLNQNVMLIGRPGPLKIRIVKAYLSLISQEMEYISLHPDISSEADLKQRREIVANREGPVDLLWKDGPLVSSAIYGRTVVIDGAERAERNVLPVLNNLLENREMNLEDGRRIVSHSTYDKLLKVNSKAQLNAWGLIRAHERFRVFALAAPTPLYPGKSIDPPFRSRFQSRFIDTPSNGGSVTRYHQSLFSNNDFSSDSKIIEKLNLVRQTLATARIDAKQTAIKEMVPEFDQSTVEKCRLLEAFFPLEFEKDVFVALSRYYSASWIQDLTVEQEKSLRSLFMTFDLPEHRSEKSKPKDNYISRTIYSLSKIENDVATFSNDTLVSIVTGSADADVISKEEENYANSERCADLISRMVQCHSLHQDMLLIGPKSSSKSVCIRRFSRLLKYNVATIYLHKEMTARDLFQRRATREDGSTYWEDSLLIKAAKMGSLAVLEGLHWLSSSISATLATLLLDRQCFLPDGTKLLSSFEFLELKSSTRLSDDELKNIGIFPFHPSFRVIATVTTSSSAKKSYEWYSEEVGGMFSCLQVDEMGLKEERALLEQTSIPHNRLKLILAFSERCRDFSHSSVSNSISLSTRQLVRICRRASYEKSDLYNLIFGSCLGPFMTSIARKELIDLLKDVGIKNSENIGPFGIEVKKDTVIFGDVKIAKFTDHDEESRSLIPQSNEKSKQEFERESNFFDNDAHSQVMRDLALDFSLGEHLLLLGNQGVGKNRIVDRFLELLEYPREYIQLHRDITVQSLLFQPILENGKVRFADSPLIKAVKFGRAIIIDEADKAPVHVISALKSLAEDGEMNLPDGRRIVSFSKLENEIPIHPQFRMIVLANRPGFPFLGNDFIGSIGEAFSIFPVQNPGLESEIQLLQKLAPTVKDIPKFVAAFQELRQMFDDNVVTYPYSLRELISIVRHLERFPSESLEETLRNVFDFDAHRPELTDLLLKAFRKHGIYVDKIVANAVRSLEREEKFVIRYSEQNPANLTDPKFGKVDKNNDPHVGGNTWSGGTGGSSTAGLGGRGGPHRLDSGNPIHQLPEHLKNQVPKEVLDAARRMGKEALERRLKEINMSEQQEQIFSSFYENVKPQIQQLRMVLEGVEAKEKERIWIRNQNDGELDEGRIVEGVVGERAIYKRRGVEDNNFGHQELPKKLKFVFDCSGSMYRFNQYDGRLTKSLETALMIMLSLKGLEHKFAYDIVGHSGDSDKIELVDAKNPPKNEKEALQILSSMNAHAQFTWSGDNTLRSTDRAISEITLEQADDYFVIVISDANLRRYAIDPHAFGKILEKDSRVSACVLFIGSLGDEAKDIVKKMPKGRAFVATETSQIPSQFKEIFLAALKI